MVVFFFLSAITIGFGEPWGTDADLASPQVQTKKNHTRPSFFGRVGEAWIRVHQNWITKIDGPRSHHRPTSSQYMKNAIRKYGFFSGFILGCDRLMRENEDPWVYPLVESSSGDVYKWDPVP